MVSDGQCLLFGEDVARSRTWLILSILTTVALVCALIFARGRSATESGRPAEQAQAAATGHDLPPTATQKQVETTEDPSAIHFSTSGASAEIVHALDGMLGPEHATACVRQTPTGARQVCVLVDDVGPYASLERGWELKDFPSLAEAHFEVATGPFSKKAGIYAYYVRKGMNYDRKRGDCITILTLPKERWPELKLRWPALTHTEEPQF